MRVGMNCPSCKADVASCKKYYVWPTNYVQNIYRTCGLLRNFFWVCGCGCRIAKMLITQKARLATESTYFKAICWITFGVQLSQILRQLLQTANLNRKAICKFCKNTVQTVKNRIQIKKATRMSGLAFTAVETRGIEPLTS